MRRAASVTQVEQAQRMGWKQPTTVSRLERSKDMKLSTLLTYMLALDADVQLTVSVEGGAVVYRLDRDSGELVVWKEILD